MKGEIGDLLFTVVNACRWLGVEAESALRQTNRKVYARFTAMERLARERGLDFDATSLDEKEELWEEAKGLGGGVGGVMVAAVGSGFIPQVGEWDVVKAGT